MYEAQHCVLLSYSWIVQQKVGKKIINVYYLEYYTVTGGLKKYGIKTRLHSTEVSSRSYSEFHIDIMCKFIYILVMAFLLLILKKELGILLPCKCNF